MQPEPLPGLPRRAMVAYTAAVALVMMGVAWALGSWLGSVGLPWPLVIAGMFLTMKGLAWFSVPLSVPAVHAMVRRWPSLGRGRLLTGGREDDPHAA